MKYFSEFIQKLIRSSIHHYQSIQVLRLNLHFIFFRYFADKGKMPKIYKGPLLEVFFRIYSKVNQVIY